jgi:hydroxyethylthiazole kinase-like uncharacterized protein yjeF
VLAGSSGCEGAALLCASAALRCGAGIVTLGTHAAVRERIAGIVPEIMVRSFQEIEDFAPWRVVVAGPGMGTGEEASALLLRLHAQRTDALTVLDADALRLCAGLDLHWGGRAVMTPHAAEAAGLLNCEVASVLADRYGAAATLAQRHGVTVVLKGADTITMSEERAWINTSGNSLLATAGSGDVLSGMIGAFCCREPRAGYAAAAAVYVHGLCAGIAAAQGRQAITAGEICSWYDSALTQAFFRLD